MIALDTSAIVAMALGEPEEESFAERIALGGAVIGTPTLVECGLVLKTKMPKFADQFITQLVKRPSIRPVAFTLNMYEIAVAAYPRFGKNSGHPAQLNFGDCMAYAVAKAASIPLLFKGNDFALTDIGSALR